MEGTRAAAIRIHTAVTGIIRTRITLTTIPRNITGTHMTARITVGIVITVIIMEVINHLIIMMTFITHIHTTADISGAIIHHFQSGLAGAGAVGTTILIIMVTGAGIIPPGTIRHTITTTRTHIVVMATIMDTDTHLIITTRIQKDRET